MTVRWESYYDQSNPNVLLNGVPTIAMGSGATMVYGMSRDGDHYIYSGLDLESGRQDIHLDLGTEAAVLDQGNNHVVAADRSYMAANRSW